MATSWDVPLTVNARAPGVMLTEVMVGFGRLTVMMAGELLILPQTAMMEAVPLAIAETAPPLDTDAMRGCAEVQLGEHDAVEASL